MFHAGRWADAFLTVSGKDTDNAFFYLKTIAQPIRSVHGIFSGHDASAKLEQILRESFSTAGGKEIPSAAEYAIRFLCLLVEKKHLKYINKLLGLIERKLDEQKGILYITVQTANTPDTGHIEELNRLIMERKKASGIKIETQVRPELLAGYLLRIGDFYIDASLRGQIEKMTAEIVSGGGKNGRP